MASARLLFETAVGDFNAGRYFEAHEHFEAIWQPLAEGAEKTLLQALIQLSVALHHRRANNSVGFQNVLERACDNFARFRKEASLPDESLLNTLDFDDVIAQAAMLESDPDDHTLPTIRLKTKTPGQ